MTKVLHKDTVDSHKFWCPGCEEHHWFDGSWTFDGSYEKPTVRPSILVNINLAHTNPGSKLCHLFLTAGMIEYYPECEHALAGKTVPMVNLDFKYGK